MLIGGTYMTLCLANWLQDHPAYSNDQTPSNYHMT